MKIVSWNVNGMKACWEKGLKTFLQETDADIVCLQETKLQKPYEALNNTNYHSYWSFADKRGYSGTACLCKKKPISVSYGIGNERFDNEGRVITLSYPTFYLINCYVPNSKGSLERYYYRMDWDVAFREYVANCRKNKPTIVCGDFNVAFAYIDIYPENLLNSENPSGFLDEERDGLQQLFDIGMTDTYRYLHPTTTNAYSWWSNRLYKRNENRGWRIDYFLVSNNLLSRIKRSDMLPDIFGSDHCPIYLEVENE